MNRKIILLFALSVNVILNAQVLLQENFNNPFNPLANGWLYQNLTTTPLQTWFQGNPSVFNAYNGSAADYLACNWASSDNTVTPETLSNWLISPTLTLANGGVLEFATRTGSNPAQFPDRLEVYYSLGTGTNVGNSATSVGTFSTLIASINPSLTTTGYPAVWTLYTNTLTGLSGPSVGRIAFRYHVSNGGPAFSALNSDFIGLDAVKYFIPCGVTVSNFTVCAGTSVTLAAVGAGANTTYTWVPGGNNTSSVVVTPTSSAVYTLYYDEGSGVCPSSSGTVTVGSQLSMNVSASSNTVCAGGSVTLSAASAATNYSWSTGATSPVIVVTPTTATTVYSVGGLSGICVGGNTISISTLPNPTLSALANPSVGCPSSTVEITASGASSYLWLLGVQASTANPVTINTSTNPAGGTYTVGLIGTGSNGCSSSGILTNSIAPGPTLQAGISRTLACVYETVVLTVTGANSYAWSGPTTSTASTVTYSTGTSATNTIFSVTGTDANGCSATSTLALTVALCTGIEKFNGGQSAAHVFPNPFANQLSFSGMAGRVEIYNALGQRVIDITVYDNETINTLDLPKGVYVVKSFGADGVERSIKLLKE